MILKKKLATSVESQNMWAMFCVTMFYSKTRQDHPPFHCCEITHNDPNICAKQHGGEEELSRMVIKPKALQKLGIVSTDAPENDCNDKSMQSDAQEETTHIGNATEEDAKDGEDGEHKTSLIFHGPDDLVGRSFLLDPKADAQRFRAHVVECLMDFKNNLETNSKGLSICASQTMKITRNC